MLRPILKLCLITLAIQTLSHASEQIEVNASPSLNASKIFSNNNQSVSFKLVDKQKPSIPTQTITISGNVKLYVPPNTTIVNIEHRHQNATEFSTQVSNHYNGSFLIYTLTFLLVGLNLF
mgnify:CR=1 FL=1